MHKFSWLRILRIWVSVVFLILIALIFLDLVQWIPHSMINGILWPQFTPSLMRFAVSAGFAASGFLLFVILTLIFGRVYCSSVCPLGTVQDIISKIRRRFFKQKPLKYSKANNFLRYALLTAIVVSFLAGTSLLINLLDPYSNFGRIIGNLVRPLFQSGINVTAGLLEQQDVFWLPKKDIKGIHTASIFFASGFLLLVGWMSFFRGRLYCNTICPVGALLGLLSSVSRYRISLDKQACNSCGSCSKVCKAQCIDVKKKEVDFSRCVTCFNCLDVCPSDGVQYSLVRKQTVSSPVLQQAPADRPRRDILRAFLLFSAFAATKAFATRLTGGEKPTTIPEDKKLVATPPGSVSHDHFNQQCTACHLCVSVCPTQVLQPSFLQYGLHGFMQPYMDFHSGFCNFECRLCGQVCPTDAIKVVVPEQKKRIQTGIAHFMKENCVVYTDKTDCGACSEHCPTKAVNMVPYEGNLKIPEVNDKICIGCGACEYACPTRPYRAIFVEGNAIHQTADEPVQEEIEIRETLEDFPF